MENKLVTIIGAGPGISRGVAEKFGNEGYTISLIARNEEKLKSEVKSLSQKGIKALYATGDAADEESLKSALMKIKETSENPEMILYNAAAVSVIDILEQNWEVIKSQMDTNAGGVFHLMKIVLPLYIQENRGKIFITNGGFAMGGDPQWTSLSVGKAALRNLVQAFQKRVKDTNIHIAQLTVCGFVNPSDEKYNPKAIAEQYWKLFLQKKENFESEIIY